jgi:hypothetical protein
LGEENLPICIAQGGHERPKDNKYRPKNSGSVEVAGIRETTTYNAHEKQEKHSYGAYPGDI